MRRGKDIRAPDDFRSQGFTGIMGGNRRQSMVLPKGTNANSTQYGKAAGDEFRFS
jgi:hypothetical protein